MQTTETKKELHYFPNWAAGRKGYAERVREVFYNFLKNQNLKLTDQRVTLLNYLLGADRHLTETEIYDGLRKSRIGKVTVFRMLKLLDKCKLTSKIETPGGNVAYEISLERPHHDHLICVKCGSVEEIRWPDIEKAQDKTCRKHHFVPLWHRHETFGYCKECAAAS